MTDNDQENQLKLDELFYYKIIDRLAHQGKTSMATTVVTALLVCVVFWGRVEMWLLVTWIVALLTTVLIRAALIRQFWQMDLEKSCLSCWARRYVFLIYCSASCWGFLPLLDIFSSQDWARSFLIFVAAGTSSGGMVGLYPLLSAAVPYVLIVLLPMIIVLAQGPQLSLIVMAIMGSFYCISLVRSTFVLNKASHETIRKELENKELFKFLKKTRGMEINDIDGAGDRTS